MTETTRELRSLRGVEYRADAKKRQLRGYAALFGSRSEPIGPKGFIETIREGAFTRTLATDPDVRSLFNHDRNLVLGRTISGTLRLKQDNRGLAFEVDLPRTSYADDVLQLVLRGDISQCSFGFKVTRDDWPAPNRRELLEIDLDDGDVSPVTVAAYKETSVEARSAYADVQAVGIYDLLQVPALDSDAIGEMEIERLRLRVALAQRI